MPAPAFIDLHCHTIFSDGSFMSLLLIGLYTIFSLHHIRVVYNLVLAALSLAAEVRDSVAAGALDLSWHQLAKVSEAQLDFAFYTQVGLMCTAFVASIIFFSQTRKLRGCQ